MSATRARCLCLAFLPLLASCVPILEARVRTRIHADGTTARETTWTKTRRGGDDDDEKRWNARPIADDLGAGLGRGFPSIESTDDALKLSGVFASPADVPADFRRDVPILEASSTRRIEFATEDLLFGTHFLYRETFVDAIQPEDQKGARRRLLDFTTAQVKRAVALEFGVGFEVGRFDAWVDELLRPTLDGIIDLYWHERKRLGDRDPHTGETGADRLLGRALARLEKLGLTLDLAADDDSNGAAAQAWLQKLLASRLDPKDQTARSLRPEDFRHLFPADDPTAGVRVAWERLAITDFGSVESLERAFQRHLYSVTGTYGTPPAEAEYRFDCALELPGLLLRTNGFLEGTNTSFWRFTGEDLFPSGYSMEAESVTLDSSLLGRLRELKPTLDRRDAVDLIRALRDVTAERRERMRELLEAAARQGTVASIAADPDRQGDDEVVKRLNDVLDTVRRP